MNRHAMEGEAAGGAGPATVRHGVRPGGAARMALVIVLCGVCGAADAQVYRWNDPDTGRARLSNRAPAWYSESAPVKGPHVVVILEGRVVDDTRLAPEQRAKLREDHLARLKDRDARLAAERARVNSGKGGKGGEAADESEAAPPATQPGKAVR